MVFMFLTTFMMSAVVPGNIKSIVARIMLYCVHRLGRLSRGVRLFFSVLMIFFVMFFLTEFFVFVSLTTE